MKSNMKIGMKVLMLLGIVLLTGCKDRELSTLREDVSGNQLSALSSATFVLEKENETETFDTFAWTATDYGFEASVNYTLEMDLAAGDFSDPFTLGSTRSLSIEPTVGEVNDGLLALGVMPESDGEVKFRIVSELDDHAPIVYSNTQTATATAYADVFPPIYAKGDALLGWTNDWNGDYVILRSDEFNEYYTITYIENDGSKRFRFFPGLAWNPSFGYTYFTSVTPLLENAGDDDNNFMLATGTPSGWYKVEVNLTAKSVNLTEVDEPVLYMRGGALPGGWGSSWPETEVELEYTHQEGVFTATSVFTADIFRFFPQLNWSPSYNYNYFENGVSPVFTLNGGDGDNNFRVTTGGTYTVTVDLVGKTVVVE